MNLHWFLSLDDAREKIETKRQEYIFFRPHSYLGDMTPEEFTEEYHRNTPDSLLLAV